MVFTTFIPFAIEYYHIGLRTEILKYFLHVLENYFDNLALKNSELKYLVGPNGGICKSK